MATLGALHHAWLPPESPVRFWGDRSFAAPEPSTRVRPDEVLAVLGKLQPLSRLIHALMNERGVMACTIAGGNTPFFAERLPAAIAATDEALAGLANVPASVHEALLRLREFSLDEMPLPPPLPLRLKQRAPIQRGVEEAGRRDGR